MKHYHYKGQIYYWYDRELRKWKAATFDYRGRQLSNALLASTKKGILEKLENGENES